VTLGRLKPRAGKTINFQAMNILLSGFSDSVTLFQSELTQDGAIHTALVEFPLRTLPE
jgi:2'-5' RNA ligase